jgi:hypothetical protein
LGILIPSFDIDLAPGPPLPLQNIKASIRLWHIS